MAKSVYDIIKKQNGEGFARVLRGKGLLDIPDIANIVKYAGHTADDAEQIFPYLWSLKQFQEQRLSTPSDPFKLLDVAGYHAFEVHNLNEQNSIKRFFREKEELCTFRDNSRYQYNYIIHAIKHDVWRDPYAIKPSTEPQRQDEYGTSVISIQISKTGGFISIKNRYNHTVDNPDQTFNSNPDEIIPGLSAALKAYFNVDWKSTGINLPSGFIQMGNQILKTNFELYNCYFGDGFYTKNAEIIDIDKTNQVQMDYFIWDNKEKKLLNPSSATDSFCGIFNKFVAGKKVTISGKAPNQTIMADGETVIELKDNQIVTLNMPGVQTIGNSFLHANRTLEEISVPDVTEIKMNFLMRNENLRSISLPNVTSISHGFMESNNILESISLPVVENIGMNFLEENRNLLSIELPRATTIDDNFLPENQNLQSISLPNVTSIGDRFLTNNSNLQSISLPNAKQIGDNFLHNNKVLHDISLPNVTDIGDYFLQENLNLQAISLPQALNIGICFMTKNEQIKHLYAQRLQSVGHCFLYDNTELTQIDLPSLKIAGEQFMANNKRLQWANLPNLEFIGLLFLQHNKKLKRLSLPKLTKLSGGFMQGNNSVILDVPQLNSVQYRGKTCPAQPAINTPITDIVPERRSKAQRFKAAIKKFYENITIKYNTNIYRDI